MTTESGQSFETTARCIEHRIEESPLSLVTAVDHAANAESVDEELPPTKLFVFGNPEIGTPLMAESRTIGIDLPQKMLVWEDGDEVKITYNDPQFPSIVTGSRDERLAETDLSDVGESCNGLRRRKVR